MKKVNISFCKWLLGIHKYSSNFGVLGEIGRYPLFIDIFKGVVKCYQKLLVKRKDKPLIHDCLCEAELIDATGGQSWITWLKYVCKFSGITNLANISVDEISSNMRSSFEGTWLDEIKTRN